jgi:hypothetical protein
VASVKTAEEVLLSSRTGLKDGEKFEVVTRSHLPPSYHKQHVARCVVKIPERVDSVGSRCLKRKRDRRQNLFTL